MKEAGNTGKSIAEIRRNAVFLTLLCLFSLIRLWLAAGTPIYVAYAVQDDALLMQSAFSISEMQWLGDYNENTLTKGVSFPLFMVFAWLSRIPYTVLVTLFWMVSAAFLVYSMKDLVKSRAFSGLFYLLLIFAPVTSSMTLFQRVYRNAVSAPTALLLAACSICLFLNIEKKKGLSCLIAILLGGSLWFFLNLREDGIWLIPFIAAAAVLTILRLFLEYRQEKPMKMILRAAVLLIIPWLILAAGNLAVSAGNYRVYGVFTRNDRTHGAFTETAKIFLSTDCPEDTKDERTVWVSRKKYEMLIAESPTLSSVREEMLQGYEKYAAMWAEDGQCDGDFYVWALREGAMRAGKYNSAAEAEAFWEKVFSELQEALDAGRFSRRKAWFLSFCSRGMTAENIQEIPGLIRESMLSNVLYRSEQVFQHPAESFGVVQYIRHVENMAGSYALYPDEYIENDPARRIGYRFIKLNNLVTKAYRVFSGVIFFGGKAAFLVLAVYRLICAVKKRQERSLSFSLLISLGLFLTALLLQFMVSWFCVFMDEVPLHQWWFYGGQGVPFYMAADLLVIGVLYSRIRERIRGKKVTTENAGNSDQENRQEQKVPEALKNG